MTAVQPGDCVDQRDRGRRLKPRAGALLGGCEVKREWDGSKYWTSLSRFVLFGARDRPDWPRRPVLQARSLPPIRMSSPSPSSLPTFPPHPTTPSCLLPPACTAAPRASHISPPTSHGRRPMPPLSCPPPPSPPPSRFPSSPPSSPAPQRQVPRHCHHHAAEVAWLVGIQAKSFFGESMHLPTRHITGETLLLARNDIFDERI